MAEKTFNHKNGFGKKGIYSEVYADSFLDRDSLILGENSDIMTSRFVGSKADDCFVFSSTVERSTLFATLVACSTVEGSVIDCEYVVASDVYNSRISGESKIKNAKVRGVNIKNVTIDGAHLLEFGDLYPECDFQHGYITGGVWVLPPKVLRFEDKNVTLCEAEDGQLHVNCRKFKTLDWIKKARHYGRVYRLSDLELEQAIHFGKSLL